ncbi:hypothetical protein Ddye_015485 [Dipteronia dyeriana]|uniref:RNase H type-1 domain-containing protein n=1 Tax=Dipteronia dyeriana TaxID=168575 RepID=A0AAD9U4Y0_9ROSI|nr:hypothetical protein Ddye_015485 [Dipteronia dyeriana]
MDVSRFERDLSIVNDVIPSLGTTVEHTFLTIVPYENDIHDAVFVMDVASTLGPDGFFSRFYQRCWDVIDWIDVILYSTMLSVLLNEVPKGYFCCSRGVCYRNPLSQILFGIVEDFLSKLLTRMLDKWGKSSVYFRSSVSPSRIGSLQSLVGGPGQKDLGFLNDSLLQKFTWKFITSDDFAFSFLWERAILKGCFAIPLGQVFTFEVELLAASLAINFAWEYGWHYIWLERDSSYMIQLLSSHYEMVP